MTAPTGRARNVCRIPHSLPDSVDRAEFACVECEQDVPKGWSHIRIREFGARCIEVSLRYQTTGGVAGRTSEGLPVMLPPAVRWP